MATGTEGSGVAQKGNGRMTADYGQRAAIALDRCITGPHRDKEVARLFGVSVRFAKYLRAGQHWTAERFSQASEKIKGFDAYIASPEIHSRLDELQAEIDALRAHIQDGGNDE